MSAYFGGSTLTGSGVADFAADTARWTVVAPRQAGGRIVVYAEGTKTWVDVGGRGRYVLLSTAADYRDYDRVPLVRDLVAVTNPFRDLNLAESTPAPVRRKHLALGDLGPRLSPPGVHLDAEIRARPPASVAADGPSLNLDADCDGNNAAASVVNEEVGSPDPKVLTHDFSVTDESSEDDVLKSWQDTKVTTDDVDSGVCSVEVSVSDVDADGFDVEIKIDNPIPAVRLNPNALQTFSITTTQHYAVPCDEGVWSGESDTSFEGFTSDTASGTANVSVSQTSPAGGGPVTVELGPGSATVTSDETFDSIEKVTSDTIINPDEPAVSSTSEHDVSYTRHIDASGSVEASQDDESVDLTMNVNGPVGLAETGSYVGARSADHTESFDLAGVIDCGSHSLTLDSEAPFGEITLRRTAAEPPVLEKTTTVKDWRTQILSDAPNPQPSPAPTGQTAAPTLSSTPTTSASTASSPTVPAPPAAALTPQVLGATKSQWTRKHKADPDGIVDLFDPQPRGTYPGAFAQDRFQGVTFEHGRLTEYDQYFKPRTSQAAADRQIKAYLPVDAVLAVRPVDLGPCGAEEWTSRSLAAAEPTFATEGLVFVTFTDSYQLGARGYRAGDVRTAFVQVSPGPTTPLSPRASEVCG